MLAEAERCNPNELTERYLPVLVTSVAQRAYHPLIRLGYALDFNCAEETAAALAYWISAHVPTPGGQNPVDMHAALLEQTAAPAHTFEHSGFGANIRELIAREAYPVGCAESFRVCAELGLTLYRSTRNFFALHLVTATQAARTISEHIDAKHTAALLSALSGSILAAHRVLGSPTFERTLVQPAPTGLHEDHTFKYGYSALREYEQWADPRYREEIALFRAADLLPSWVRLP